MCVYYKVYFMRKGFCFVLAALFFGAAYAERNVTLADRQDRTPIAGASVISNTGLIIGTTNSNGQITVRNQDYPLSLRSLGYEALTYSDSSSDTIFMSPATYILNEVVVTPADRPITRVVTFAREYCTGATATDTMQYYCEYMLEYYFADGKVKGYSKSHQSPNRLAAKRYGRISRADGTDSIMRPNSSDDITTLSFATNLAFVPYDKKELTDAMMEGALTDTIAGKYFPKYTYRLNNGNFIIDFDALADHENHTFSPLMFKLLGLTMDMYRGNWTLIYRQNESGKHGIEDFIYNTANIHFLGKGKLLKKVIGIKDEIHIDCFLEQYPVEIEHLTPEEYLEQKKTYNQHREPFQIPQNLQPLPPSIQNLLNRIEETLPTQQ